MTETEGATGCLLVAPSYLGQTRDDQDNAIANQAREQKISCWTVDQLSRVVEAAERRHISAAKIYNIVTKKFAPVDVSAAIDALFAETPWDQASLVDGIIEALRKLEARMVSAQRSVDMVATQLANTPGFDAIEPEHVEKGLQALEAASQGALSLGGEKRDKIQMHTSLDELEHRVTSLTKKDGTRPARKPGTFRRLNANGI